MWDLLIGKAMMAFFGWNCYVAFTGLSYLEYKNLLEINARRSNAEANGKQLSPEDQLEENDKHLKLVKFNFGFATRDENIVRVLKTTNYVVGFWFTDWGEDPLLAYNGTEWTTFWYFNQICDFSQGGYSRKELD